MSQGPSGPIDNEPVQQNDEREVVVRPDGEQGVSTPGMGTMGMVVFMASLAMLFAASIAGFLVIRFTQESWPPPGAPGLPKALWLSTLLALGCSATMQLGLNAIKAGRQDRLNQWLIVTNILALGFLGVQGWAWFGFFDRAIFESHLYGFTFYMLTGLHALHVIGGMIALGIVNWFAFKGAYTWAFYPGVRHSTMYWHFLDGVWIVLYAVLLLTS